MRRASLLLERVAFHLSVLLFGTAVGTLRVLHRLGA
jgi:hypothetical protein